MLLYWVRVLWVGKLRSNTPGWRDEKEFLSTDCGCDCAVVPGLLQQGAEALPDGAEHVGRQAGC